METDYLLRTMTRISSCFVVVGGGKSCVEVVANADIGAGFRLGKKIWLLDRGNQASGDGQAPVLIAEGVVARVCSAFVTRPTKAGVVAAYVHGRIAYPSFLLPRPYCINVPNLMIKSFENSLS